MFSLLEIKHNKYWPFLMCAVCLRQKFLSRLNSSRSWGVKWNVNLREINYETSDCEARPLHEDMKSLSDDVRRSLLFINVTFQSLKTLIISYKTQSVYNWSSLNRLSPILTSISDNISFCIFVFNLRNDLFQLFAHFCLCQRQLCRLGRSRKCYIYKPATLPTFYCQQFSIYTNLHMVDGLGMLSYYSIMLRSNVKGLPYTILCNSSPTFLKILIFINMMSGKM